MSVGSSALYWVYYDAHGNVVGEANASGATTAAHSYDPFGAPLDTVPTNTTTHRYVGSANKNLDTASNLILMGARPYDPGLGRFLETDPVDGGSCNTYDYVCQDPINGFDLDGRDQWGSDRFRRTGTSLTRTSRRFTATAFANITASGNNVAWTGGAVDVLPESGGAEVTVTITHDNADVFSTTFTATLGPSPWNAISGSISSAPRGVYAISVFVQPLLMGAFDATRDEASVGEPQPRISVSIGIGASVRPGLGIRTR